MRSPIVTTTSVAVEKLEGLNRQIVLNFSEEELSRLYQKKLQKVSREISIKGFRPGRAPIKLIKERFGAGIYQEIVAKLAYERFEKIIKKQKLYVFELSELDFGDVKLNELKSPAPVSCTALFSVFPEIHLKDFGELVIERYAPEITELDIETAIDKLRKEKTKWNNVERPAKTGDRVWIDFEGTLENKPLQGEGGSGKNFDLILSSGRMWKDFEEALEGMSAGDTRQHVDVSFPQNYFNKALAGKTAEFKITVNRVAEEGDFPNLDDAFAKEVGIRKGGISALRDAIRELLAKTAQDILNVVFKQQLFKKLLALNPIPELPEKLVRKEMHRLVHVDGIEADQHDFNLKDATIHEKYRKLAERNVGISLLIEELKGKFALKLDHAQIPTKLHEMSESGHVPIYLMTEWYRKNKQFRAKVQGAVLEDQVLKHLQKQCQIQEKRIGYQAALKLHEPNEFEAAFSRFNSAQRNSLKNREMELKI